MNRADLVYAVCHLLGLRPEMRELERTDSAPSAGAPPLPLGERELT